MTDKVVFSIITNNKFSSASIISHLSGIPENLVENSIRNLLHRGLIYQSVGGYPKRYSNSNEKFNYINDLTEDI